MLPESLAPSLREQLSRARAWWLKDQAEVAAALCFPTPFERKYHAPGILASRTVVLRSTRIRPIHGAVSCVAITCMTRLSAFKRAVEQAGIIAGHTAHPPPLVRDGLAPQRLRYSNRAGSARPFRRRLYDDDLHAC